MCALKLKRLIALGSVALFSLVYSTSVLALRTDAGTQIDNTATVGYKVGGVDQTAIDSAITTFYVDQVVDFVVAEADSGDTDVGAGELDAVARFTVTNTGNETQDFVLSVLDLVGGTLFGNLDNIQADALTIFVDVNDNDVYDAGDTATFIDELSADDTAAADADNVISVFVLGDIPAAASSGDAANIELTATAHVAGGAAGLGAVEAETGGNDDTGSVQVIFSAAVDAGTTTSAQDSYLVGSAILTATKDSTVASDPLGQAFPLALAIPGAFVQYEVTITNSGGLPATEVQVTDAIPSDLTFETGTYNGAASDVEIVVGASAAVYCIAEIGGDSNSDGCFLNGAGDSLTVSIPVSVTYPTGLTVGIDAPADDVIVRFQASIN